jgi:hypothetical protein
MRPSILNPLFPAAASCPASGRPFKPLSSRPLPLRSLCEPPRSQWQPRPSFRSGGGGGGRGFLKPQSQKINPIAIFCLLQSLTSYLYPRGKCMFAQTVNRTKMFPMNQFGTIERESRRRRHYPCCPAADARRGAQPITIASAARNAASASSVVVSSTVASSAAIMGAVARFLSRSSRRTMSASTAA